MDDFIARLLARTNFVSEVFWESVGPLDGGWQVSVEDWRPEKGLCERCGRGAGLLAVVVYPDALRVDRLGEECLGFAGLPPHIADSIQRGLRAARGVGKKLSQGPQAGDEELAKWHPSIAVAVRNGLGVPDRWRRFAKAARAREAMESAMVSEGLVKAEVPSVMDIAYWWRCLEVCPQEVDARGKLSDLMPLVLDGLATPRQHLAAAKILRTPWAKLDAWWPDGWLTWGAWPDEVAKGHSRQRRRY